MAINQAQALVEKTGDLPVPLSLRNAPTKLMKQEGYGKGYQYAHNHPHAAGGNFIAHEFMPDSIAGTVLYDPQANAREQELRQRLRSMWGDKYGY
jgi:putative ATPase